MIEFSPADIDRDLAIRAHSGTSFSPERRADSVIDSYAAHLARNLFGGVNAQ